jgi:hypothetical protein
MNEEAAAAAELALKIYALNSDFELRRKFAEGERLMQRAAELVALREAPEDAVCSLVLDLMHYCKREDIDWPSDVIDRARSRFHLSGESDQK